MPASLLAAVEARFRDALPPLQEAVPATPRLAAPASSASVVGDADEDGLVRAIWADPFDDLPRHAYADWLEERGKPHQASLLRTPERGGDEASRFTDLLRDDAPCRFKCMPASTGLLRVHIPLRSMRTKAFARDGAEWMRRHHVAEIAIVGTPRDGAALFAAGWLGQARGLALEGMGFANLESLACSVEAASLASLSLAGDLPPYYEACRLPDDTQFRSLCRLAVGGGYVPRGFVESVADASFACHLRCLSVHAQIRDPLVSMLRLADREGLGALVTLELVGVGLGDSDIKALVEGTVLASLRNLDLAGNDIREMGIDALAGSPLLPRLRRLRLTPRRESPALLRLARAVAATPRCRLVLEPREGGVEPLSAILGDRLVTEQA